MLEKKEKTTISKTRDVDIQIRPKGFKEPINELELDLGRQDLNSVVDKLNEVIRRLNT